MKLRLTRPAARQLDRVLSYIAQHHPQGARHVNERIRSIMFLLLEQPHAGHVTARSGVHRFVASPYPYALTYRVIADEILVIGIRHTSRRPVT